MSDHEPIRAWTLAASLILLALACSAPGVPTPQPTPNIEATVSAEVETRLAAVPTATSYPTATPRPTYTRVPPRFVVATATPEPTSTPRPTLPPPPPTLAIVVPEPAPTPTPVLSEWENGGDWYRDHDYELGLKTAVEAMGMDVPISVATLDSSLLGTFQDLSLSLGCIGLTNLAYLTPYSFVVPSSVDTYTIGVWDTSAGEWESDQVLRISNPGLTDDKAAVFISSNAQIREIVDILKGADANQKPELVLTGGIFDGATEDGEGVWGEFVPTGLEGALDYLPCF